MLGDQSGIVRDEMSVAAPPEQMDHDKNKQIEATGHEQYLPEVRALWLGKKGERAGNMFARQWPPTP